MTRFYVSAAHKSSGKTTISVGITAALSARGLRVQTFKKGPDYIDPQWLRLASGRPCYNLDYNTQSQGEILSAFARRADADAALIEGNKGLYDGMDLEGRDCNASLAGLLGAPVVLVISVEGVTRGIAPLLLGYQAFDPSLKFAGVILNRVASSRQEAKLRQVIERYTSFEVLGAVRRSPELAVNERHLGLTTPLETGRHQAAIAKLAEAVEQSANLDRLLELASAAGGPAPAPPSREQRGAGRDLRVAVARDSAFSFYYADDLEALEAAGAELVFFSPLADARLPEADALLLGGGFPETHMAALEANAALRAEVRAAVEAGLPAYAECGGLMYLCRSIQWGEERREMAGVIPADVVMGAKPQGYGLVTLTETSAAPWGALTAGGDPIRAHEFHYARLENVEPGLTFAYDVTRGHGVTGRQDGVVIGNLLAGFTHLRHTEHTPWANRFVELARRWKTQNDRWTRRSA
jgi:cobyrinic acid a,c-diamide synthase